MPVVPGRFVNPTPISTPPPKYPKILKKTHSAADVTVVMVITKEGDAIDATVVDSSDRDSSSSALAAIGKYRFKPATLDGEPVASLARVVVSFRIR
jgi:protein TonB